MGGGGHFLLMDIRGRIGLIIVVGQVMRGWEFCSLLPLRALYWWGGCGVCGGWGGGCGGWVWVWGWFLCVLSSVGLCGFGLPFGCLVCLLVFLPYVCSFREVLGTGSRGIFIFGADCYRFLIDGARMLLGLPWGLRMFGSALLAIPLCLLYTSWPLALAFRDSAFLPGMSDSACCFCVLFSLSVFMDVFFPGLSFALAFLSLFAVAWSASASCLPSSPFFFASFSCFAHLPVTSPLLPPTTLFSLPFSVLFHRCRALAVSVRCMLACCDQRFRSSPCRRFCLCRLVDPCCARSALLFFCAAVDLCCGRCPLYGVPFFLWSSGVRSLLFSLAALLGFCIAAFFPPAPAREGLAPSSRIVWLGGFLFSRFSCFLPSGSELIVWAGCAA